MSRTNSHDFEDYQSTPNFQEKHSVFSPPAQYSGRDPSSDMQEDSGHHVSAYSRKRNYSLSSKDKEEMGTSVHDQYNETGTNDKRGHRLQDPASVNPKNVQGSKRSRIASMKNKGQISAEKV